MADDIRRQRKKKIPPKITEEKGTSLKSVPCKTSPKESNFKDPECCVSAGDGSKGLECGKKTRRGIGDESQCMERDRSDRNGETNRSLDTSVKEEQKNTSSESKPLSKHTMIYHSGKRIKFKIRKTGSLQDPLSRQTTDDVRINNSTKDFGSMINPKAEYQHEVPIEVITSGFH